MMAMQTAMNFERKLIVCHRLMMLNPSPIFGSLRYFSRYLKMTEVQTATALPFTMYGR